MCCSKDAAEHLQRLSTMEAEYMYQMPAAMWFIKENGFLQDSAEQILDTAFRREDCLDPAFKDGQALLRLEEVMVSIFVLYA